MLSTRCAASFPLAWKSRNEQTFTQRKSTNPASQNMLTGRRTNAKSNNADAGPRIQEIKEANKHLQIKKKKKKRKERLERCEVNNIRERLWVCVKGKIRAVVSHAGLGTELEMLLVLRRHSAISEVKLPLFNKKKTGLYSSKVLYQYQKM